MNKLAFYRKKNGLTQEELGRKLNIPKTNISAWENGSRTIPVKHISQLSKELKLSEQEILNQFITPVNRESRFKFYRKRSGLKIERIAQILKIPEYVVTGWETHQIPFDQEYNETVQKTLCLTNEELLDIISDSEFIPEQKRTRKLSEERALSHGKSFREINNDMAEAFRKRAIEKIILTDIDPAAKNTVLQILAQL